MKPLILFILLIAGTQWAHSAAPAKAPVKISSCYIFNKGETLHCHETHFTSLKGLKKAQDECSALKSMGELVRWQGGKSCQHKSKLAQCFWPQTKAKRFHYKAKANTVKRLQSLELECFNSKGQWRKTVSK